MLTGPWADMAQSVREAQEQEKLAKEKMKEAFAERDTVVAERDEIVKGYREKLESLTESSTEHLELQQVLDHKFGV